VVSYSSSIVGNSSLTAWGGIALFDFAGLTIGPVFGRPFGQARLSEGSAATAAALMMGLNEDKAIRG